MISPILDFFIFFARHMVLAFGLFFVISFVAMRCPPVRRAVDGLSPLFLRRCALGFCVGLMALFVAIAGWYLFLQGFAGEVEPVVSSLSWMVSNGQDLYTDFNAAERYSVLYGPSVFLTNGLFLEILGPSLASAKLASLLGILGCLVFLYAAVARRPRDLSALAVVTLAVLYFWSQGFAVYLVRPDALLLFAVGLGLFAALRLRPWLAVATLAAAIGFSVNLKVHGVVYFLPAIALFVQRCGWRKLVPLAGGGMVVVAAPFVLHSEISLVQYVGWLRNAMDHGLVGDTLVVTIRFVVFLILPIVVLLAMGGSQSLARPGSRILLKSLVPTTVLAVTLSAKPGAGLVHMLPLVPSAMLLVGLMLQDIWGDWVTLRAFLAAHPGKQAMVAAVFMTALLSGTVNEYRAVKLLDWQMEQSPNLVEDLQQIMTRYPDLTIAMACGGENANFRHTWLRPLLVFANHPVLLDPVAIMDCKLSGKDLPEETYAAMAEGAIEVWLVPRHMRPFEKENWYAPHDPVFSQRFMKHFEAFYSPKASSRYFDLWFWKGQVNSLSVPASISSSREAEGSLLSP